MDQDTATEAESVSLCELPAIKQSLAGGIFAGLTTLPDGTHCAVVLLADKPAQRLDWKAATAWAESVGGQLPTRPVAAMLFATSRAAFERAWHWTNEVHEVDGAYAWDQDFYHGSQLGSPRSFEGCARAVRLIHLVP